MATVTFTSGDEYLLNAAHQHFRDHYGNPRMYWHASLHRDFPWVPALRFIIHQHIHVFVESSHTTPYPQILRIRSADVRHFPQPIQIYTVCPEDRTRSTSQRTEMKRLQEHGYGLVTVDSNGLGHRIFSATPLVQVIPRPEFNAEIKGLSGNIRRRISEAFEIYQTNPANGVQSLSEVIEGIAKKAGADAVKAGYLSANQLGTTISSTLDAMHNTTQLAAARAPIGGVRSFISEYRNLSSHWPRSRAQAHKKYADCRHAFLDGIKRIVRFRIAMRNANLTGNLPRT